MKWRRARLAGMIVIGAVAGTLSCRDLSVTAVNVARIVVVPASSDIFVGQTVPFSARVEDGSGRELRRTVTWRTDATAVAVVSPDGRATGVAPGTARITASADGHAGTATVVVEHVPVASVEVTPSSNAVAPGDSVRFEAKAWAAGGAEIPERTFAWTSSNTAVAVARSTGWVRGVTAGSATIAATVDGVRGEAAVNVRPEVQATAELVVTQSAPPEVGPADTVVFSIQVRNAGPAAASSVVVTDTLPANATFIDATPTPLGPGGGAVLTWPTLSVLVAGGFANYSVRMLAPASGSMRNVAAARSATPDGNPADNRSVMSVSVTLPDLAITKSASASSVSAGDTVTYTIRVTNHGGGAADGVAVTDTLHAGSVVDAGGATQSGNVLRWTIGRLGAGASATFTTRVAAPATAGNMRNAAAATAASGDSNPGDNHASVTVAVSSLADLVVTKAVSDTAVSAGDTVSFTITVRNAGPSAAADVVVTDTLGNGTFTDIGGATQSGSVLTWPTITSLAPGAETTFTAQAEAANTGFVRNVAVAATSTPESSQSNNMATVATTIRGADLAVAKTGPAAAILTDTLEYTIVVTNNGPGRAVGIVVQDVFSGASLLPGSASSWNIPELDVNDSQTLTLKLVTSSIGTVTDTVSVTSSTVDPDSTNNRAVVITVVATTSPDGIEPVGASAPARTARGGLVAAIMGLNATIRASRSAAAWPYSGPGLMRGTRAPAGGTTGDAAAQAKTASAVFQRPS